MKCSPKVSFATSLRTRNPKTGFVEEEKSGAFTTPGARIAKVVNDIKRALEKKIKNFKPGTDALLICSDVVLVKGPWKALVLASFANTPNIPYKRVYVCDNDTVHIAYEPPTLKV